MMMMIRCQRRMQGGAAKRIWKVSLDLERFRSAKRGRWAPAFWRLFVDNELNVKYLHTLLVFFCSMNHHHVEKKYWLQLVVERPLIWGPSKKRFFHRFAVDLSAIARDRHRIMIGADKILAMWATLCAPPGDDDDDDDGDGDGDGEWRWWWWWRWWWIGDLGWSAIHNIMCATWMKVK